MYDKDIQQEVLAKDASLTTFENRYKLITAMEFGRLTKNQLDTGSSSSHTHVIKLQYKKISVVPDATVNLMMGRIEQLNVRHGERSVIIVTN